MLTGNFISNDDAENMPWIFFLISFFPSTGLGLALGDLVGTSNGNSGFWYPFCGMCSGCVLFIISYFYFDAILPNEFGIRKPCCFCFGSCCKKKKVCRPGKRNYEMTESNPGF